MNIEFRNTNGFTIKLIVNKETTIDSTIKYYLRKINRAEYIGGSNEYLFFSIKGFIHFGDQTPLREYFENNFYPMIVVNDEYNKLSYNWTKEDEEQIKNAKKRSIDEIAITFNKCGFILGINLSKYLRVSELINK